MGLVVVLVGRSNTISPLYYSARQSVGKNIPTTQIPETGQEDGSRRA